MKICDVWAGRHDLDENVREIVVEHVFLRIPHTLEFFLSCNKEIRMLLVLCLGVFLEILDYSVTNRIVMLEHGVISLLDAGILLRVVVIVRLLVFLENELKLVT